MSSRLAEDEQLSLFSSHAPLGNRATEPPAEAAASSPAPKEPSGAAGSVRSPVAAWPARERPLGKLLARAAGGAAHLSDAELLSLFVPRPARSPESGELLTRLDVARHLLEARGSLGGVLTASPHALTSCPGIGRRTAGALVAAGALTRRLEAEEAGKERLQVTCPADVAAAYGPELRGLSREVFKVVLLNTANVIESDYTVSTGGLAASIVEPRGVFQEAILRDAAAVICLHNHPSGNPEPSREDTKITRQLAEGGELLGIPVHDHLIIAGRGYTSLAERGVL